MRFLHGDFKREWKKAVIAGLISVVLIFIGYTAYWMYFNKQLSKELYSYKPNTDTDSSYTEKDVEDLVIIKSGLRPGSDAYFGINKINLEGSVLEVDISYSGGCKEHDFILYWDGKLAFSIIPTVNLHLAHNSNQDGCEAYITNHPFYFNLSKMNVIDRTVVLRINNDTDPGNVPQFVRFKASLTGK